VRPRRPTPLLTGVLLAALVLAPAVASSAQSLQEVRAERTEIQRRLDAAAERLGATEARVARLEAEGDELAAEVDALAADVSALQEGMQDQVVALFKRGSVRDPLTAFLTSDDASEALLRAQFLEHVVVGELGEVEALGAERRRLTAVRERLADQQERIAAALAEQRELRAELEADLARAAELEERLEAEERERRRKAEEARRAAEREREARRAAEREAQAEQAAAPASSGGSTSSGGGSTSSGGGGSTSVGGGGKACPVGQPHSFTDTWGAPRSGGRSHRGTDILAPYGTPVYAMVDGTWSIQSPGPSAGLWAILRGDDGNHYWYLHLQSHTVSNGARVSAGQQTATNGDTGNARGTPHVHFELHPGGGGAVNPYPMLRAAC
jgi:murein DD-endopeptidase MepM/ murein hydrolase activator NlpD